MASNLLCVRVSLKGRLIKDFRFSQGRITIGRDPDSNVFLDNQVISRCHAVIECESDGVYLRDMESANGTLLNERPAKRERLKDGDQVRVGKFLLELSLPEDRRGAQGDGRPRAAAHEGTMLMAPGQLQRLIESSREAEDRVHAEHGGDRLPVAEGNVVRMPQGLMAPSRGYPAPLPVSSRAPIRWSSAWWRAQLPGLCIGFVAGLVVAVLLVGWLGG